MKLKKQKPIDVPKKDIHTCSTSTGHPTYLVEVRSKVEGMALKTDNPFGEITNEWRPSPWRESKDAELSPGINIPCREDYFLPKGASTMRYESAMALVWSIKAHEYLYDKIDVRIRRCICNYSWEILKTEDFITLEKEQD